MTIKYLPTFFKHYKKRIASQNSLKKRFDQRVKLFIQNKNSSVLQNHRLTGDLEGYYAFSVIEDVRVVYKYESKDIVFDRGTHN